MSETRSYNCICVNKKCARFCKLQKMESQDKGEDLKCDLCEGKMKVNGENTNFSIVYSNDPNRVKQQLKKRSFDNRKKFKEEADFREKKVVDSYLGRTKT